tara:strand:- start:15063 stop:15779 length:717 start_codon:yes stop_codon:yes gene_type:complete
MSKVSLAFLILILCANNETVTGGNPYQSITERNAFELTDKEFAPILPPVKEILAPSIFLTGISRWKGIQKVHLVLRKTGEPDKFVSLTTNEKQYNVELKEILHDSALVSSDGDDKLLSFENNGFPTIVTKAAPTKKASSSSRYSRDRREGSDKKEEKKSSPPSVKAQVVTVPSRRSQVDPRIIEKGLEYLSRMEEGEKRDYLLKRMESLQSGQHQLKTDIDQNERRRQYDEYRRRRDK